jgi:hypothetical protein
MFNYQAKGSSQDTLKTFPLDKKHMLRYVVASVFFLLGVMGSGVVYLWHRELLLAVMLFMPFLLIPVFDYFGLI